MAPEFFPFSNLRFHVVYNLTGSEVDARTKAEALCFDQTVELSPALIQAGPIRDHLVGRVEHFQALAENRYSATLSFSCDLVGKAFTQLLNVIFGITSLKPGIRVVHLDLPDGFIRQWRGARFGRPGLRRLLGVPRRPLVCSVLKPVGLPPAVLAERAYQMALGGLDLIKDDQGLVDQPFCSFEERVSRCAEAIQQANRETGRKCLYVPNVTVSVMDISKRSLFARQAGAGGVLICPGLVGFDAVNIVAQDDSLGLPVMTHPTLLGSLYLNPLHGMSPAVVFGQLPRLAGADVSIYPGYDGPYSMSREDCLQIASETDVTWGHLHPIFPTAAGRIAGDQIKEILATYHDEVVIVIGGALLNSGQDVFSACRNFMRLVENVS